MSEPLLDRLARGAAARREPAPAGARGAPLLTRRTVVRRGLLGMLALIGVDRLAVQDSARAAPTGCGYPSRADCLKDVSEYGDQFLDACARKYGDSPGWRTCYVTGAANYRAAKNYCIRKCPKNPRRPSPPPTPPPPPPPPVPPPPPANDYCAICTSQGNYCLPCAKFPDNGGFQCCTQPPTDDNPNPCC